MHDVHCHLLPGIDDGARGLETALEMARAAHADGITHLICTPHIYPGLYENTPQGIEAAVAQLRPELEKADIPLELGFGADIQVVPELLEGLRLGKLPTLNGSRYFLFEPPHHVPLPNFLELVFQTLSAGYVPVITHPERLSWIGEHYDTFLEAARQGAWIQLTAGSLTGRFGSEPRYWSEKMLDDGIVHLLATDAHNMRNRPPFLAEGAMAAVKWVGSEEARRLIVDRPRVIWENGEPDSVTRPPAFDAGGQAQSRRRGRLARWFFGS